MESTKSDASARPLEGARILVIDDHADLAENLEEILAEEGASVRIGADAQQGRALAREPFDVALVDVRLPDARGIELVPELRTGDGHQEVLLITGHASIQDAIEAVRAGAYAYVLKPFDPEELTTTVSRAVERVRLRRQTDDLQGALKRSEDALRTMVDTVQALLLVLDADGRVVQANQAVASATGVTLDEVVGEDWISTFVAPRDQELTRSAFEQLEQTQEPASIETAVLCRDDSGALSHRIISWRLSCLGVRGQLRIYASGLDMTDVRELERRARLAEKLAAVGTVSAGLAHEIRNPLNAAGLQLQLLERRVAKVDADGRVREAAESVRSEIGRLSRLVTEFLLFARPQAITARPLELDRVVREVVHLERHLAEEKGVDLTLELADEPLRIEGDAERLKQVVLNLVGNAIDAVGEGGRVHVSLEPYGAEARIVVRDDGPGIPQENLARIFEPFFTTKEQGTGLGMAICHSLVELHGGSIGVENDSGAKFTITLPRRALAP